MTTLGKTLVYINTFIAVVLFGWAVSLYTNRVDWFDRTPEGGDKVEGQLTQLQAEVKRFSDQIKAAQQAYAADALRAADTELVRDYRNYIFKQRMDAVQRVDDKVQFLTQLREPKSALIDVRNNGPVINGLDGKPLQGLASLRKKFDDLSKETLTREQKIVQYRTEYAQLCDEIDAVQDEVLRQKIIAGNLQDEQEYLADARINWEQQLRTLEIRQAHLQARLAALGAK